MTRAASRAASTVDTAVDWAAGMLISAVSHVGCRTRTIQSLDEQVTVFGNLESADRGTQHLNTETLKDTHLVELNTNVEGRLSTKRQKNTIRTLLLEHVGHVIGRYGQEVNLGSKVVGRLDGRDVRVDQNRLDV